MFKFIRSFFKEKKPRSKNFVEVGNKNIPKEELDDFIHSIVIQEVIKRGSQLYSDTYIEDDGTIVLKITDENNKEYFVESKYFVD
jgi:hypothetical protein